jgi:hypothetical protein
MIRRSYQLLAAVVCSAALGMVSSPARADTVNTTLDKLVDGGSQQGGITLGDKRYSNFTFSSTGDAPVAASAVDVSLISSDNDNHYQLRFSFTRDTLDAPAGQTTDAVISYQIDVLGTQLINRVGLAFDGTVAGGNGDAAATVIETVRTSDGSDLIPGAPVSDNATMSVVNDGASGDVDRNSATLDVNPTRSLMFTKDILVSSRPGGGTVTITTVDNFVDQVPEPMSAGVLGAVAGLAMVRRRRA